MKLGISIELYNMNELEEKVQAAVAASFRYCQMFLREVDVTRETVSRVAEVCQSHGLKIGPVGAYANPLRPDDAPMGWTMNKVKRLVELLPMLGSSEIVMWSGSANKDLLSYSDGNFDESTLEKLADSTADLLDLLQDMNGTLIYEPYYTHVLHDVTSILALLKLIDSDRVKVVIDPPNYISPEMYERRDAVMMEMLGDLRTAIGAVHFKDFRLLPDKSWDYPGPGGGVMNYRLLFHDLISHAYSSWGIIEHVKPQEYLSAKTFIESQLRAAGQ